MSYGISGNDMMGGEGYVTMSELQDELIRLIPSAGDGFSISENGGGYSLHDNRTIGGDEEQASSVTWEVEGLHFVVTYVSSGVLRIQCTLSGGSFLVAARQVGTASDPDTIEYPDMTRSIATTNGYVVGKFYYDEGRDEWNNNSTTTPVFSIEVSSEYPDEYTYNSTEEWWEVRFPLAYVKWAADGSSAQISQININSINLLGA